jgi:hypothetical protein
MSISSKTDFTETSRMFDQIAGYCDFAKLTHKINHQRWYKSNSFLENEINHIYLENTESWSNTYGGKSELGAFLNSFLFHTSIN